MPVVVAVTVRTVAFSAAFQDVGALKRDGDIPGAVVRDLERRRALLCYPVKMLFHYAATLKTQSRDRSRKKAVRYEKMLIPIP